jgi:sec-independent protein translocase protein TatA
MRGLFEGWHIVVLLLLIVVLFGYKRLPDVTRSLGRSMRIFKSEVESLRDDDDKKDKPKPASPPISGRIVDEPEPQSTTPESTGDERR